MLAAIEVPSAAVIDICPAMTRLPATTSSHSSIP